MNGSKMISLREDKASGIIYREWISPSPKAVLLLVHGLGAHSGRWQFLGDFLSARGVSSYGIELRGFGKTKDMQGHVDSFDIYFNDILRLYDIAVREDSGLKVFIAGESAGSLIAYLTVIQNPDLFKGLICLSPAVRSSLSFSLADYVRMAFLLVFNPKKQLQMPFDSASLTHDTDYQREMDTNGLEHRLATPKMILNIALAQARILLLRNKIKAPVLFLIAGSDALVDPGASKSFFKSLKIKDKELIEYPGMYHSLSVEYGKEQVFEHISEWLSKRLQ